MHEYLRFKWGTLKAWYVETEESIAALQKYFDLGVSFSVAMQEDTPEHKQALCELIEAVQGEITNDWTGESMTKEEAKAYVMEYKS